MFSFVTFLLFDMSRQKNNIIDACNRYNIKEVGECTLVCCDVL